MAMTATPHAPPHVFLLDAARQAQLPPARLLDLALRDPQLKLFIDQTGWVFDADRDDGDRNDHERVVEGQS